MSDNVVEVACPCPGTPHATDTVVLAPKLTIPIGRAAMVVMGQGGGTAIIMGGLAAVYLRLGIIGWTFTDAPDEDGDRRPAPITPENIERFLPFWAGGLEVAERASSLYDEDLTRPLVARLAKSSPRSPMELSTPPTNDSGLTPPMPFAPSSPNGTAGKRSAARAR